MGVLAQSLETYQRTVAYFSKQLDEVNQGWPTCLRAVAAVVLNIQEECKFTLGQRITVLSKRRVLALTTEVPQVSGNSGGAG